MDQLERPKQSWAEFVASMPKGRAPGLGEIAQRWSETEPIMGEDADGKPVERGRRSKENGEGRAYLAWLTGSMEPEEEAYFKMLNIRVDHLVLLAIVPVIRSLVEKSNKPLIHMTHLRGGESSAVVVDNG